MKSINGIHVNREGIKKQPELSVEAIRTLTDITKRYPSQLGFVPASNGMYKSVSNAELDSVEKSAMIKDASGQNGTSAQSGTDGTTGHDVDPNTGMDEGVAALRFEWLEPRLVNRSFQEDSFVLWRALVQNKEVAENSVYQYTTLERHGSYRDLSVPEWGIGHASQAHLHRYIVPMKYIAKPYSWTIASQIANNMMDTAQFLGITTAEEVIANIEQQAFYGDSSLMSAPSDGETGLQFDGILKNVQDSVPGNIIDEKGNDLSINDVRTAVLRTKKGSFGNHTANHMFMSDEAYANFVSAIDVSYMTHVAIHNAAGDNTYPVGTSVPAVESGYGKVLVTSSSTLTLQDQYDESLITANAAGLKPGVAATVNAKQGGTFNMATDDTLAYRVVITGADGDSLPADQTAVITEGTDTVSLAITLPSLAVSGIRYVTIYRQEPTTGAYFVIGRVGASAADANNVITFTDTNAKIPGTTDVFIGSMDPEVISLAEFLPLSSIPLATQQAEFNRAILWYGALIVRIPRSWVVLRNVNQSIIANPQR